MRLDGAAFANVVRLRRGSGVIDGREAFAEFAGVRLGVGRDRALGFFLSRRGSLNGRRRLGFGLCRGLGFNLGGFRERCVQRFIERGFLLRFGSGGFGFSLDDGFGLSLSFSNRSGFLGSSDFRGFLCLGGGGFNLGGVSFGLHLGRGFSLSSLFSGSRGSLFSLGLVSSFSLFSLGRGDFCGFHRRRRLGLRLVRGDFLWRGGDGGFGFGSSRRSGHTIGTNGRETTDDGTDQTSRNRGRGDELHWERKLAFRRASDVQDARVLLHDALAGFTHGSTSDDDGRSFDGINRGEALSGGRRRTL